MIHGRKHRPSTRCHVCGKPMTALCDATRRDGKPCNLPMCEEHRHRVADVINVDVCNRPHYIAQAVENRIKREEAQKYFFKKYQQANIRVVPGHWPDFKSKEEVDSWFESMENLYNFISKNEGKKSQLPNQIIFVDICNTLCDINSELEKRGCRTDIYPSPISEKIFNDGLFASAEPIQPVIDLVKQLSAQGYKIIYITARSIDFDNITKTWLKKYNLPEGTILHTFGDRKGEVAQSHINIKNALGETMEVVGAIEDSPAEIRSYVETFPGIKIYIPDWEYNSHIGGIRIDKTA